MDPELALPPAIYKYRPEITSSAEERGLALPAIFFSDPLRYRMARHNKRLSIDEKSLYQGIDENEIEDRMEITFSSHAKDSPEQGPKLVYRDGNKFDIKIAPDPVSEGVALDINKFLWTGIIASDKVFGGRESHFYCAIENERKRNRCLGWAGTCAGGISLQVNSDVSIHAEALIRYSTEAAFFTGLALLGYFSIKKLVNNYPLRKTKAQGKVILGNLVSGEANTLAATYPVVSYADLEPPAETPVRDLFELS